VKTIALLPLIGGLFLQIALSLALWAVGVTLHWLYVGAIAQVLTTPLIVIVSLVQVNEPLARPGRKCVPIVWQVTSRFPRATRP
jgi:hypothetical protein